MSGQRHPDSHVSKARTVDEAVAEALLYLGARRNEVDVEVLDEGSPGLLGLIGRRPAVVKVTRRRRGGRAERAERKPAQRAAEERREEGAEGTARSSRRRRRRPRRDRDESAASPATSVTREEAEGDSVSRSRGESTRRGDDERPAAPAATSAAGDSAAGNEATAGDRPRKKRRRRRRKPRSGESRPETTPAVAAGGDSAPAAAPAVPPAATGATVTEASTESGGGEQSREQTGGRRSRGKESAVKEHRAVELVPPHEAVSPSPEDAAELQRSLAAELMRRGGFLSRCTVEPGEYNQVRIVTDGDSAAVLIGHHGHTIDAVEHLVDRMSARILGVHVPVNVDINNYRRRREGQLVSLARRAMSQVRATGEEVHLPPQNARDRRVIHLEVAEYEGLTTYSDGEGLERHVVVTLEGKVPDWYQPPVKSTTDDGEPAGTGNGASTR